MNRLRPLLVVVVVALAISLAGCGSLGINGNNAAAPPTTDNSFIPKDENLSDCVGTLERPNCGSSSKGDVRLYLTFGVLMTGMAFIGWRIAIAIRKRDRDLEEHLPEHTY